MRQHREFFWLLFICLIPQVIVIIDPYDNNSIDDQVDDTIIVYEYENSRSKPLEIEETLGDGYESETLEDQDFEPVLREYLWPLK